MLKLQEILPMLLYTKFQKLKTYIARTHQYNIQTIYAKNPEILLRKIVNK